MTNAQNKITSQHLERMAIVYVRQSTLIQVREHQESTARQYGLVDVAVRLGWDRARVVVIDADQGHSGRDAADRQGFQDLVRRVCLGEAGAVFGLEISRLARSSADLQRLLEFCSLTGTLIVDADGVYDLHSFNDRLLLGLKGTMSEAELHILAGRLKESQRAAARRGELRFPLPVGYVWDSAGKPILDPSEEIREAIAGVFAAFEVTGSANGVAKVFTGRPFPRRAYGGAWGGEVRWGRLSRERVAQILSNPAYAGAYAYGKTQSQRGVSPEGIIRKKESRVARKDWHVLILDHHPAYLSWDAFLAIEKRLAANHTHAGARPPREGAALLQGIVLCGACGLSMSTRYPWGRAKYYCFHAWSDRVQTPGCRMLNAVDIDRVVTDRLLAVISAEEIRLALAATEEVQAREASQSRYFELQLERARYEATRAERSFHCCEPENRLVARTLERTWEEKLQTLADAEAAFAEDRASRVPLPPPHELGALAENFSRLWAAPSTSIRDRKRILRTLISDVTVMSQPAPDKEIRLGIRWQSGATEELVVNRPTLPRRRTPPEVVEAVRQLANSTDDEIAAELDAAGFLTGSSLPFTGRAVRKVRVKYHLPLPSFPEGSGEWTIPEISSQLGITGTKVYYWVQKGYLQGRHCADGRMRIAFPPEIRQACLDRLAVDHLRNPRTQNGTAKEAV